MAIRALAIEYPSGLVGDDGPAAAGEQLAAQRAKGAITAAGRAVLPAIEDDLQVQLVPHLAREQPHQIGFGAGHALATA